MSDKSREELEERVDELEATVKKMLPSRRQVLKGSATAAGAGMLGFSAGNATAQASTEDGDGNVGDPDNPVDLFADGVDASVVNTENANNIRFASAFSGSTGSDKIRAALDDLPTSGGTVVVGPNGPDDVSGNAASISSDRATRAWEITDTPTLGDDVTLVLWDCYWFLSGSLSDNILRNSDLSGGNVNISIEPVGQPILDGNAANHTHDDPVPSDHCVNFYQVDDLRIGDGLTIRNPSAYALTVEDIEDCSIGDVEFDCNDSTLNQDGVHLIGPCDGVSIGAITGVTGDDGLAIGPGGGNAMRGSGGDIDGVTVDSVNLSVHGLQRPVKIWHNDGYETRGVSIGEIVQRPTASATAQDSAVWFGGTKSGGSGRMRNVTIGQINAVEATKGVIYLDDCEAIENVTIGGITAVGSDVSSIINNPDTAPDTRFEADISNVYYNSTDSSSGAAVFWNGDGQWHGTATNWTVKNAGRIFDVRAGYVDVKFDNINHADNGSLGTGPYQNIQPEMSFGGNVPTYAEGTWTISGGSGTGIKTNGVSGVISDPDRPLRIDHYVDTAPTSTHSYRILSENIQWDDSTSDRNVTLRVELLDDPGSDITMGYEIKPS